jgi:glycosyltransferase involved in cell wall biosynthesis
VSWQAVRNPLLVSIAICTRDRATLLRECLAALQDQVGEMSDVEILIVDNGSTDDTQQVAHEFADCFPHWRCVSEPQTGLSHARNRALAVTEGDWVAFLDDDARPLAGYIARLKKLAREGAFDCVGGIYLPWYAEGRAPWFRDEYASNATSVVAYGELPAGVYASGGNCLFRRAALEAVGGFSRELGMRGHALAYGEETRVQIEMRQRGYRIGGDPALRVEHLAPQYKQDVDWLLASAVATGRNVWQAFDRRPSARLLLPLTYRLITRPLRNLYRLVRSGEGPRGWRNWLLALLMPLVSTWAELREGLHLRCRGSD